MFYSKVLKSAIKQSNLVHKAYPDEIIKESHKLFGIQATEKLSVVGAYNKLNTLEHSKVITIDCKGNVKGLWTLYELYNKGYLNSNDPSKQNNILSTSQITAAIPQIPFIYVFHLKKKDRAYFSSNNSFTSSLPIELQYPYAAMLPLGPKLKSAHHNWCIQENLSIGEAFKNSTNIHNLITPDYMLILKYLESLMATNQRNATYKKPKSVQDFMYKRDSSVTWLHELS